MELNPTPINSSREVKVPPERGALDEAVDLSVHSFPSEQVGTVLTPGDYQEIRTSAAIVYSGTKIGWIERNYNPKTWDGRTGIGALAARAFFKVFARERSAWIIGSGFSFAARIGAASVVSLCSDSRVLLPVLTYAVGILVNWPITYGFLRVQDLQDCRQSSGELDEARFRDSAKRRKLFLPKQELGFLCCFAVTSTTVMLLSLKWPIFFGATGGAVMSLGTFVLQGALVNHYEAIFAKLGVGRGPR